MSAKTILKTYSSKAQLNNKCSSLFLTPITKVFWLMYLLDHLFYAFGMMIEDIFFFALSVCLSVCLLLALICDITFCVACEA